MSSVAWGAEAPQTGRSWADDVIDLTDLGRAETQATPLADYFAGEASWYAHLDSPEAGIVARALTVLAGMARDSGAGTAAEFERWLDATAVAR
jgi:hypothetical protein